MLSLHQIAELVSLSLTPLTILASLIVVAVWGRELTFKAPLSERQWFILGVALGFLGSSLDNSYWAIPWTMSFIGDPAAGEWFSNGVYSNIPFRQGVTTIAALCHIKAASMMSRKALKPNVVIYWGFFLGLVFSIWLILNLHRIG